MSFKLVSFLHLFVIRKIQMVEQG